MLLDSIASRFDVADGSGQHFVDDSAVEVGEAEVSAGVSVGQSFVIESQEVQDRGWKVADQYWLVSPCSFGVL